MKQSLLLTALLTISISCAAQTFTLKSNDVQGQATTKQVFNGFGCSGENTSPELHWENPPSGVKSFAVTMFDEDAPTGSGWWHWLLFDLAPDIRQLVTNAGNPSANLAPKMAIQSRTDFGLPGYGGPCPPPGKPHRYIITVYALDIETLGLQNDASPALVGFMLEQHVIQKASIVFYYQN